MPLRHPASSAERHSQSLAGPGVGNRRFRFRCAFLACAWLARGLGPDPKYRPADGDKSVSHSDFCGCDARAVDAWTPCARRQPGAVLRRSWCNRARSPACARSPRRSRPKERRSSLRRRIADLRPRARPGPSHPPVVLGRRRTGNPRGGATSSASPSCKAHGVRRRTGAARSGRTVPRRATTARLSRAAPQRQGDRSSRSAPGPRSGRARGHSLVRRGPQARFTSRRRGLPR